ncbi:MAG TPA: cytidylate kinase-like family protein [Gemmatimonadaceae bacterium]
MPIITVSRQFGAGGSRVAEKVADALGWQLYDNAMVDEIAARLGTTVEAVSARDERAPSLAERVASTISLTATQFLPDVSGEGILPSEERIVDVTKRVMEEAVSAGPAVIVGRGAQCLLAMRSDALHVFCYAPLDALVARTMTSDSLSREEARRKVIDMNAGRAEYVKRYWSRDWRDVANYHLCVDTAWLGIDGAAELIVRVARTRLITTRTAQ